MANFLSHGCLETIEACLIIGNALAYNMNPGVAYIVLGMTLRSALSIGLHVTSQKFSDEENYQRGRIWWALAWQDSHFSVSYDRPSSSILCFPDIPYTKQSSPGRRSYVESMSAMIRFTQQILRDRTLNPRAAMTWSAIQNYKDEVSRIVADAQPRLRDVSLCTQVSHHLERLAFKLHSSYMLSEICRPALREPANESSSSTPPTHSPKADRRTSTMSVLSAQSPNSTTPDANLMAQLRADCILNLERTIEAFVETHERSIYAARSWIGIQRSISGAFLLGILQETRQDPRVVKLLMRLEKCLAARAHEEVGFDSSFEDDSLGSPVMKSSRKLSVVNSNGSRPGMSESPNWARSMTKSLQALGKLNAALMNKKVAKLPQNHLNPASGNSFLFAARGGSPNSGGLPSASASLHNIMNQYPPPSMAAHGHSQPRHHQHHASIGSTMTQSDSFSPLSQSSYPLTAGGPQRPSSGAGIGSVIGLGPMTPDNGSVCSGGSGNDWNPANFTERALEFVAPGLWG